MTAGHPLAPFDTNTQRLYQIAANRATQAITHQVFQFLPVTVRKALVAEQILILLFGQDPTTDDTRVRTLLNNLYAANEAVFAE